MTRKHFEEVAEVIKENTMNDTQPIINKKTFINDLCVVGVFPEPLPDLEMGGVFEKVYIQSKPGSLHPDTLM